MDTTPPQHQMSISGDANALQVNSTQQLSGESSSCPLSVFSSYRPRINAYDYYSQSGRKLPMLAIFAYILTNIYIYDIMFLLGRQQVSNRWRGIMETKEAPTKPLDLGGSKTEPLGLG